jgi:hypothetical protein
MSKKCSLDNCYYILYGVNPENKLAVFWFNVKQSIKRGIPYRVREFYRKNIETIWRPQHSRLRRVIPRYWHDLDHILVQFNFEVIKSFYEDEYVDGPVDWNASKKHKKFAVWLEKAYTYVTKQRPLYQKLMLEAYPTEEESSEERNYQEMYGKVDYYENLITKSDTIILNELIKNREYFWT